MILSGRCKSCDFENSFKYGGNRFDHQTNCPVPTINIETDEFENVNYFEFDNIPKYKLYSNNQLKGDNEGNMQPLPSFLIQASICLCIDRSAIYFNILSQI